MKMTRLYRSMNRYSKLFTLLPVMPVSSWLNSWGPILPIQVVQPVTTNCNLTSGKSLLGSMIGLLSNKGYNNMDLGTLFWWLLCLLPPPARSWAIMKVLNLSLVISIPVEPFRENSCVLIST